MGNYRHKLSKSAYISGKQCLKRLYLQKKYRHLASAPTATQEAIMQQGTTVGELAQAYFPGGVDCTPESYYDFGPSIEQTQVFISDGKQTLYEASFFHDQVLAALDIWHREGEEVWAIEVKSSTSVKEYHLDDAALQYWIMEQLEQAPNRFFIMHLNNQYVRGKALDIKQLFTLTDITELVKEKRTEVGKNLQSYKAVLAQAEIPEVPIGPHCGDPFACEFINHCWQHIPSPSVFDLSRIGTKAYRFYEEGKVSYEDLKEESELSGNQKLQVRSYLKNEVQLKPEGIKQFLGKLEYPLYFFDFETINPAIPLYEGSKPYEQIGVQYSLHWLENEKAELKHLEFLSEFQSDPRPELAEQLIKDLGSSGSIIAYNMSFEQRVIKSLAESNPEIAPQLLALLPRFKDLIIPFSKKYYYHPKMHGSASIKAVLPALFPHDSDLSYDSLTVSEGGTASTLLQAVAENTLDPKTKAQVRQDLLAYCKLDTLAMVKIWEKLREVV